jgi:hypothetical protein
MSCAEKLVHSLNHGRIVLLPDQCPSCRRQPRLLLMCRTMLTAFLYSAYEASVSSGIWDVIGALPRVSRVTSLPSSISCLARYAPMKRVPPDAK